jgi:hypothetical protein
LFLENLLHGKLEAEEHHGRERKEEKSSQSAKEMARKISPKSEKSDPKNLQKPKHISK